MAYHLTIGFVQFTDITGVINPGSCQPLLATAVCITAASGEALAKTILVTAFNEIGLVIRPKPGRLQGHENCRASYHILKYPHFRYFLLCVDLIKRK